jgi:hypothetical protein
MDLLEYFTGQALAGIMTDPEKWVSKVYGGVEKNKREKAILNKCVCLMIKKYPIIAKKSVKYDNASRVDQLKLSEFEITAIFLFKQKLKKMKETMKNQFYHDVIASLAVDIAVRVSEKLDYHAAPRT